MFLLKTLIVGITLSISFYAFSNESYSAEGDTIRIVSSVPLNYNSVDYYSELLQLALTKTETEFGPFKINYVNRDIIQERALHELNTRRSIDVYWSVSTKARETVARPIRIPLLKGLIGYRVSLILKDRLQEFQNIESIDKFRELAAGQGHDWPDYDILKFNKFSVFPASLYGSIIELLHLKRIDHFPRGLNEILREFELMNDERIMIEPKFILHYPSYVYFFVAMENMRLAERIEKGLLLAQQDGSFNKLFRDFVHFDKLNEVLNLESRKIIELKNPISTKSKIKGESPIKELSKLISS
ncbi:transporter substrate-binding domain-containing protein [Psychrosphaera haliotis]|uniref:hypothetical protein n=1 Tax=Psychrosphaera haliotis TaxID=555083 RepID=UPI0031D12712